jgi:hypothetical protein
MPDEVKYAVAAFADEGFQRKVWLEGIAPSQPYAYDFEMACHALLDDVDVTEDSDKLVDAVLKNEYEVAALRRLGVALLDPVQDIGVLGTFDDALASSRWPAVGAEAKAAVSVIGAPDSFP